MEGMIQWFQEIGESYYTAFIEKDRYMAYLNGFKMTLLISLGAVLVGVIIGTILAIIKYSAGRSKKMKFFGWLVNIYLTVFRGTPVYVQLLIIYYVVFTSRGMPAELAGIICFGLNSSAYVAEIIRAGIEAVDRGQTEAGRSLGLNGIQTMGYIVLPQAIRNILPALGNEITKAAQNIGGSTYDILTPLVIAAAIYLIVVVILTKLLAMFERRLARSDRR